MTHEQLDDELQKFMNGLIKRNPGEPEFHQAVQEVAQTIIPFVEQNQIYKEGQILERLTEPDRIIIFRVCWQDDNGNVRTNRGYRVQFNNSIGPYKGGLRFHPSVNQSVLKFLGFEQIFKNSLTTLPIGGAKGGSNFNPKGKSDGEIMRFCQSFMTQLCHYIGQHRDVPAGDIGVGAREIGYMFGQYKRLLNEFTGVLTGKGLDFGGSLIRTEATGYGCIYFAREMLEAKGDSLAGKECLISGSGNVAQYAAEKILHMDGKVMTFSDSSGTVFDPDGIDEEKLEHVKLLKNEQRQRISKYVEKYPKAQFLKDQRPWNIPCFAAFPCATQNELEREDAETLIRNGCKLVAEGANMPTTIDGVDAFTAAKIQYAPGKAANAGGVAISGLEMTQNSLRLQWTREEVDGKLQSIMKKIHTQCERYGREKDYIDYVKGANIAGFVKVADTMLRYGVV